MNHTQFKTLPKTYKKDWNITPENTKHDIMSERTVPTPT